MKTTEQIALDILRTNISTSTDKAERKELRAMLPDAEKAAEKANKKQALELLPNLPQGKKARSGNGYELALLALVREDKVATCYNQGSGKWSSIADYTSETLAWLDANGHKYETGNNAPRGGKNGQWVKVVK